MRRFITLCAFFAVFCVGRLGAASIALTGWTGGVAFMANGDQVYGWFFDTSATISVSALGVYDLNADGLLGSHEVGIFRTSDKALLISTTVPAGGAAPLLNDFRYAAVAPYILPLGSYVIAMTMPDGLADRQFGQASSPVTASPITYVGVAAGGSGGLVYPSSNASSLAQGMFGPNFQFNAGNTQVPEPSTALLLLAGLGILALRRR